MTTAPQWHGTLFLEPGRFAFAGEIGPTTTHAHHATQIMIANEQLELINNHGEHVRGQQIIVPADAPHRITNGAKRGIALFLDPRTTLGVHAERRAVGWVPGPTLDTSRDFHERSLEDQVFEVSAALLVDRPVTITRPTHPSVARALELLPLMISHGTVTTADVAERVDISVSRLTHLFTEQVGWPLRRYVLWLRLMRAVERVADGDDLTTAAHTVGFSDSAHLTRTANAMFGLGPSELRRAIESSN